MSKKTVLKLLEQSKYWEDGFVEKYDSEVVDGLLKTLPKKQYNQIKPLLEENITESEEHMRKVQELIEKIRTGKYDI